jgi:hypothetical protein
MHFFKKMGNESSKSNGGYELNGRRRGSTSEEKRAQLAMAAEARIKKNTANDVSKAKRVIFLHFKGECFELIDCRRGIIRYCLEKIIMWIRICRRMKMRF